MKRNLFALISAVLSLSEFSIATLSAATDYKEHKFQDGIYTVRADKKAEKSAVAASKENSVDLVAATRSSNIYEQEAGAGIKMTSNLDDILKSLEVGSQILVLNINSPWSRNCRGCGYWGYYDPFYWDRWYDPFWRPWDPFWYDRWRWGWGPYYAGHWGPWGPWGPWRHYGPYGPDPWWPGYRPIPVYPVHPARPVGTYVTAMRGGNHNMGGGGLNRRIATPAGGSAGSSAIGGRSISVASGSSARVAASGTNQPGRVVSRVPEQRVTPVGTSVHGSKVVTTPKRQTTATSVVPSRRQTSTATTVIPSSRQTAVTTSHSRTPNAKINNTVRSNKSTSSSTSRSTRSSYSTGTSSYSRSSYGGTSSSSYSGGASRSSYSGGASRSSYSGGGMSRSVSSGGHGRR